MTKLMIVDDEADVREFAANFFRKRKIEVITASSGQEALTLLAAGLPHLLLLDINMSGMDGIETLEKIKEHYKELKVIMVTGKKPEENESYKRCMQLGVLAYIHKPLELDDLEKVVLKELLFNSSTPGT